MEPIKKRVLEVKVRFRPWDNRFRWYGHVVIDEITVDFALSKEDKVVVTKVGTVDGVTIVATPEEVAYAVRRAEEVFRRVMEVVR